MRPAVDTLDASAFPAWLTTIAVISVVVAVVCAIILLIDIIRHPQPMKVMNVIWPITALFGSVLWLAAYLWWGRAAPRAARTGVPAASTSSGVGSAASSGAAMGGMPGMHMPRALGLSGKPHTMPVSVFVGTCHCGGGCSLADLIVEWSVFAVPGIAVLGGAGWIFQDHLFAVWVLAFVVAWLFGVAFQYFAIKPMRHLTVKQGIIAAIKADTLSITAWQVGMYGTVAIFQLLVFPAVFGGRAGADTFVFWFMMQLAMLVGFATAYPMNWMLIHFGLKERM